MIKKTVFSLLLILSCYLVLEVSSGLYFALRLKKLSGPPSLIKTLLGIDWQNTKNLICPYRDTMGPHPYLGYIIYSKAFEECILGSSSYNNVGFSGPHFPEEKNADEFVIMVTGGSVADQLGTIQNGDVHFVTSELNTHFYPPKGKRFRVVFAALGDYRQPQNIIAPILHHDLLDGIIDIGGYNEMHQYHDSVRLERPSPTYWSLFDKEVEIVKEENHAKAFKMKRWAQEGFCQYSYTCILLIEKFVQFKINNMETRERRYTDQKIYFEFPKNWSKEKIWQAQLNKHKGYYRIINSICNSLQYKCAFFLQPMPQLGKTLTSEEKEWNTDSPGKAKTYARMVSDLLSLQKEGIPLYSLIDVFADEKGTIYRDHIHYLSLPGQNVSRGNKLLLEAISNRIGAQWGLKKRK